jgi:hypothetical protein
MAWLLMPVPVVMLLLALLLLLLPVVMSIGSLYVLTHL